MDKKLVVSRAISQNLRVPFPKLRNKEFGNERYSQIAANAKHHHNSNHHFHRSQPKDNKAKKQNLFETTSFSLSNEEYINANAQIWLNEECLQSNFDYNDIYSQWESIIQINFYTSEEIVCPICMGVPTISRTDICGHVYCLPCLYRFLSYESGFYNKCALCNQQIDINRIKRASFIPRYTPNIDDKISMLLMKRDKSESFAVPINSGRANLPFICSNNSRFSNVAVCSNADIKRMMQFEISTLEKELIDSDEQSTEIQSILESLEFIHREFSMISCSADTINNNNIAEPKGSSIPFEFEEFRAIQRTESIYYQSEDGSNIFMCPLNWKLMVHEFIDHQRCLPLRITGRIVEIERFTVSPEFINRYRYLSHLPHGATVSFVDIDLSEHLSYNTIKKFEREIHKKNENRFQKEKIEADLTKQKIKHENSFNLSEGFICLNSLMQETNNLLDDDFVPLCPSIPPVSSVSDAKTAKRLSFADMVHQPKKLPLDNFQSAPNNKETETASPIRGFSLQDCLVKKPVKRSAIRK